MAVILAFFALNFCILMVPLLACIEIDSSMNNDLVLREYLALERTKLGNERTLLAYIRTGLYFLVAGSTLGQVMETTFWKTIGDPLLYTGVLIMVLGVWRFIRVKNSIAMSKKNIGNATDSFVKTVRGDD